MHARKLQTPLSLGLFLLCASGAVRLTGQPLELTGVQRLANQEVALTLAAPVGRAYRLESAADLPVWSGLFTFPTNVTTSLVHTDSAAPFQTSRFYRAVQLTGTNIVSGDHLVTTNGEVIIQPRNHATFVLQWNGKMIYFDPASAATFAGLPKADLLLITHAHNDHLNTATIDTVRGPGCVIIAPQLVYNSLTAAQKGIATVLINNTSTNVLGLTVNAVPAHNPTYHNPGEGNGYVLGIGGRRIYVSGDTGDQPELRALLNIDVAFVCMNQPYTMTVSAATNFVRTLRPEVVYPYHYRDQSGATANAATF
jgi:L-ascorbate metabolism protein UlaG (beta-lactamase superfamily)